MSILRTGIDKRAEGEMMAQVDEADIAQERGASEREHRAKLERTVDTRASRGEGRVQRTARMGLDTGLSAIRERGLRQVDLARVLGVVEDTERNWEKGRTSPPKEYLRRIEGIFKKNY